MATKPITTTPAAKTAPKPRPKREQKPKPALTITLELDRYKKTEPGLVPTGVEHFMIVPDGDWQVAARMVAGDYASTGIQSVITEADLQDLFLMLSAGRIRSRSTREHHHPLKEYRFLLDL